MFTKHVLCIGLKLFFLWFMWNYYEGFIEPDSRLSRLNVLCLTISYQVLMIHLEKWVTTCALNSNKLCFVARLAILIKARDDEAKCSKLDPLGHRSVLSAHSWVGCVWGGQMINTQKYKCCKPTPPKKPGLIVWKRHQRFSCRFCTCVNSDFDWFLFVKWLWLWLLCDRFSFSDEV